MISIGNQARIIKPHRQDVYIEGALSFSVKCTSCDNQNASFKAPMARWDSQMKHSIHGKKISVSVNGRWLFAGYADTTSATVSPDEDSVTFEAKSVLIKLRWVYVGQQNNENVVYYDINNPNINGIPDILLDLFADMPIYGNTIKLGDTTVLDDARYVIDDSFIFRSATYQGALDQILSYCGDVVYIPRFFSGGAYIDFYRVSDNNNGTTVADLARYGDDVIYSNVADLSEGMTSTDKVDQVTVYGPRKFVLSCISDTDGLGDPETSLIPGWDTALETLVLSMPDAAKKGTPAYREGAEFVFRRYYLPACLRPKPGLHDILPLKDLPVQKMVPGTEEPVNYATQAYVWQTTLAPYPDTSSNIASTGTDNPYPTQSQAQFVLDQGYVLFSEPALKLMQVEILLDLDTGKKVPRKTYQLARVGITFGIENAKHVMSSTAGTGAGNPNCLQVTNERLYYAQYTNIGYPIKGVTFASTLIYREDASTIPQIYVIDTAVVLHDDTAAIQKLSEVILKERRFTARQLDIKYNFISTSPRPGNRLVVTGTNDFHGDDFAVTDVSYDLESYTTSFSAENVKPLHRSEVNGK